MENEQLTPLPDPSRMNPFMNMNPFMSGLGMFGGYGGYRPPMPPMMGGMFGSPFSGYGSPFGGLGMFGMSPYGGYGGYGMFGGMMNPFMNRPPQSGSQEEKLPYNYDKLPYNYLREESRPDLPPLDRAIRPLPYSSGVQHRGPGSF